MDEETKNSIELEVRRALAKEETSYREFLQLHFKQLTWGIGILFSAAGIVASFLIGNSLSDLENRVDREVDI